MIQYISNLWNALLGNNPYQTELDEVLAKYKETAQEVAFLKDIYKKNTEAYESVHMKVVVLEQHVKDGQEREKNLQQVIESLRERVADKERELTQQDADFRAIQVEYQKRVEDCNREIARLKETKTEK